MMPGLAKAEIDLTADVKELKRGLSEARRIVRDAARKMGSMLRKGISGAFSSAFRKAKLGLVGLIATLGVATRAAMKQEEAEVSLAAALKAAGNSASEAMPKFKEFASQLQKTYAIGDETTLKVMQMGMSLGVSSEELEKATKMAIGLGTVMDKDLATSMRYVAIALQGETNMLRRYIPELRQTEDYTEQMAIIQEVAAKGLKVTEEQAESTAGAYESLKNNIGDVLEIIGAPITDKIKQLNDWWKENQESITAWGEKAADVVSDAINKIGEYAKKLKTAFGQEGWRGVRDELVKTAGELADAFVEKFGDKLKSGVVSALNDISGTLNPIANLGKAYGATKKAITQEPLSDTGAVREEGENMPPAKSGAEAYSRERLKNESWRSHWNKKRKQAGRMGDEYTGSW